MSNFPYLYNITSPSLQVNRLTGKTSRHHSIYLFSVLNKNKIFILIVFQNVYILIISDYLLLSCHCVLVIGTENTNSNNNQKRLNVLLVN